MPAYKDKIKGTWYASFYYENWTGKKEKKMKRGFKTKHEALEWERTFLQQKTADLDMTFKDFVALYEADMKGRMKENTWGTKEHILYKKLVPYFGNQKMCDIHSKEVMAWQNEMLNHRDKKGKPYSPVYLKTLHNQLSAVFNHAVKHYNLKTNPAAQAGNMGKARGREMLFWTKPEYLKFADAMMDKPLSYYAFEMLYWCGIREGELLALTPSDFDFEKQTVSISKSYQRIKGKDVITDPKTVKSNRVIQMPTFLCEEMQDYQSAEHDIFVGGDCYTGPKFAIEAIAAGKEGAISISRLLRGRHLTNGRNSQYQAIKTNNVQVKIDRLNMTPRQTKPEVNPSKSARTFSDLRVGLTEEQIKKESMRCLHCGQSIVDTDKCIGCGVCTHRCEFDAIHLVRVDDTQSAQNMANWYGRLAKNVFKRGANIIANGVSELVNKD